MNILLLFKKINSSKIKFFEYGYTPNKILIRELEKMDFMVLPSRKEGLSRALESIERGVIPILSDIDEHKELVDDGGCICLKFSKNMKISNLLNIIENKQLKKLSDISRKNAIQKYDLDRINAKIINIMNNA